MWTWLRPWLQPSFADEDVNRRARLLNVLTLSGFVFLVAVNGSLVVTTIQRGEASSTILASVTVVVGLLWAGVILFLSRQGRINAGSQVLLWGGVAMTVLTNLT
ncbi:MAG: hypothetical protein R6V43_04165, partial [Halopseudomonas sp.]